MYYQMGTVVRGEVIPWQPRSHGSIMIGVALALEGSKRFKEFWSVIMMKAGAVVKDSGSHCTLVVSENGKTPHNNNSRLRATCLITFLRMFFLLHVINCLNIHSTPLSSPSLSSYNSPNIDWSKVSLMLRISSLISIVKFKYFLAHTWREKRRME